MLLSQFLLPTTKEIPANTELISHQLMIRSGMIRQLASGLYTWLPLGLKVLKKIKKIIHEELKTIGALELSMPTVQPAELWKKSQRWDQYGAELLRFKDRHERSFCYAPTYEEVTADLIRNEIKSYKQLPLILYHIQTKFRDEIRPRFGVIRAREFLMKDAYSFHLNQASLNTTYQAMYQAYTHIFKRLHLKFRPVLADTGSMGGDYSHEFQALTESGEDCIAYSNKSDYAANIELANALVPEKKQNTPIQTLEKFAAPSAISTGTAASQCSIQTLIAKGSQEPLIALILRSDDQLNEIKAGHLPELSAPLEILDKKQIKKVFGISSQSLGPIKLDIPYIVDHQAAALSHLTFGANEEGTYYRYAQWGRDIPLKKTADLRQVIAGDISPDGKGKLKLSHSIEVGHIFQLGDVYTRQLNARMLDPSGQFIYPLMGCYGIGVSRVVAAVIEQHHDSHGIVWPSSITPFDVAILPLKMEKCSRVQEISSILYNTLCDAGLDVLMDDRQERAGVKFSDIDLIGIPHRIIVSEKSVQAGTIEYKARRSSSYEHWPIAKAVELLKTRIKETLNTSRC